MVRILTLLAVLLGVPAFAAPFTLDFTWTPDVGLNGNSGDSFAFHFVEPTGQLQITSMSVTLGSGMVYDLTNASAPGYLTYGPYAEFGDSVVNGHNSTLAEGGSRTVSWNFTNFVGGTNFGFSADVDEAGTCSGMFAGLCMANVDHVSPNGFVERGAIDLTFHVASLSGAGDQSFTFTFDKNDWDLGMIPLLAHHAKASFSGDVDPRTGTPTPEPSTLLMGAGAAAVFALRRRIC